MKIIFAGTGSGKASLTRENSSFLLGDDKSFILIDCGEGISKQLLQLDIPFDRIGAVVISHFHADHLAGLPGLITQMKLYGRKDDLQLFVPANLENTLNVILNSFFIFKEGLPFKLIINGINEGETVSLAGGMQFRGVRNSHINNKYNVDYVPEENFLSYSFLFSAGDKNIFYTADVGGSSDLLLFDEKADFIIAETTHIPHEKFLQMLVKYEPEKIILNHIDDENRTVNWLNSLDKKLKKYFTVAFDGMTLEI